MNKLKNLADYIGISRLVVIGILLLLMISVFPLGINPGMHYSDCLVRVGNERFPGVSHDDFHRVRRRSELWSPNRNPVRTVWRLHCSAV